MTTLTTILEPFEFTSPRYIQGRLSIADLFPANRRCGVYVLHFENEELYVGKAIDVTRRYVQHCKIHKDIAYISFKQVQQQRLDEEERNLIWGLEDRGCSLRNITFTSYPKGESDLDLVVSPQEQSAWLAQPTQSKNTPERTNDLHLRRKYAPKWQQFLKRPASPAVINALKLYVKQALPYPYSTELSFWSCSCLPSYSSSSVIIYSRVNINWQEVCTVSAQKEAPELISLSLHVALSPLEEAHGLTLDGLFSSHPDLAYSEHFYEPGGHDQINLVLQHPRHIRNFFNDQVVQKAIRLFNLRLMQKGACAYSKYHCFDLADHILP